MRLTVREDPHHLTVQVTTDPDVLLWLDECGPPRVIRRDKHPQLFLALIIAMREVA